MMLDEAKSTIAQSITEEINFRQSILIGHSVIFCCLPCVCFCYNYCAEHQYISELNEILDHIGHYPRSDNENNHDIPTNNSTAVEISQTKDFQSSLLQIAGTKSAMTNSFIKEIAPSIDNLTLAAKVQNIQKELARCTT